MSIIDEIRARCEAATPGPWKDWGAYNITGNPPLAVKSIDKIVVQLGMSGPVICYIDPFRMREGKAMLNKEDAEFIAHSREDIPYLIGEIHGLIDKLEQYRQLECDERLIKLPIRPGTTVWVLEKKADHKTQFVRERFVNSYRISTDEYIYMQLMVPDGAYPYPVDDIYLEVGKIGKIIFTRCDKAEAALNKQQE